MNVVRKKKLSDLRHLRFCLLAMGTAWVVVAGLTPKANAETFIVTTVEDGSVDDVGTFRWAVDQANNNEDELDTIAFDEALESFADSLQSQRFYDSRRRYLIREGRSASAPRRRFRSFS